MNKKLVVEDIRLTTEVVGEDFVVKEVHNDASFCIGDRLSQAQVDDLCVMASWNVKIVRASDKR